MSPVYKIPRENWLAPQENSYKKQRVFSVRQFLLCGQLRSRCAIVSPFIRTMNCSPIPRHLYMDNVRRSTGGYG
jgi:hypothetical protein